MRAEGMPSAVAVASVIASGSGAPVRWASAYQRWNSTIGSGSTPDSRSPASAVKTVLGEMRPHAARLESELAADGIDVGDVVEVEQFQRRRNEGRIAQQAEQPRLHPGDGQR